MAGILCIKFINACRENNEQEVKRLISLGHSVNGKTKIADEPSADGMTPLHLSCMLGHKRLVLILLYHKAEPNAKTDVDGLTPLHMAIHADEIDIVKLLSTKGKLVDVLLCFFFGS